MNFSDTEFFPPRRKTRPVKVGRLTIGGDAAIAVQSMTKTDTREVEKTVEQIQQMEAAGCEIVRLAVPIRKPPRRCRKSASAAPTPFWFPTFIFSTSSR